jgi:hypothetical protein
LPFEIGGGDLLLIKELMSDHDAMTHGGGLLLGSFGDGDQGIGGRKGWWCMMAWRPEEKEGVNSVQYCSMSGAEKTPHTLITMLKEV